MNALIPSKARLVHLPKLLALRESMRAKFDPENAESHEWRVMDRGLKVVVLLMAGFDDGNENKKFQEFAPPERLQIKLQLRSMRRELNKLAGLVVH